MYLNLFNVKNTITVKVIISLYVFTDYKFH